MAFLTEARSATAVPVAARITVRLEALRDPATLDALDARATALLARDVALWIAVESAPPAAAELEAWNTAIGAVIDRLRSRIGWLEVTFTSVGEPRLAAFALKRRRWICTRSHPRRGCSPAVRPVGDAGWLERVYAEDVASYLDGLAAPNRAGVLTAVDAVNKHDAGAIVGWEGRMVGEWTDVVDAELVRLPLGVGLASYGGNVEALRRGLSVLAGIDD